MSTTRKERVAALSIISNTFLIFIKILAGVFSGSVSIISEAIHSGMDLLASLVAYFSVKFSAKPADSDHPYGHGKIENVSGLIEGILILIAAFLIIKEAVEKLLHPQPITYIWLAIAVMGLSALVNFFVSKKLYRVAKEEDSIALEADALHLKTDVYTSIGVAVGIALIYVTGLYFLDSIVAILVALLILKESWALCSEAFKPLMDSSLSDEDKEKIKGVLEGYEGQIIDFHELRTRKAGPFKYIDFHMTVNKDYTVEQSHDLCEAIEKDLEAAIKNTSIHIHIEPGSTNTISEGMHNASVIKHHKKQPKRKWRVKKK